MADNKIKFGIGFNVDQTGLKELKRSLQELQRMSQADYMNISRTNDYAEALKQVQEIQKSAKQVSNALDKSYNKELGSINMAKLNQEMQKLDINKIARDFDKAGSAGRTAFRRLSSEVAATNLQLKESYKFLDKMAETMGNTLRWGISSSVMNSFTGSISKAYSYVRDLDESLTSIRIVSGQSAEQMDIFAKKANDAAKALGSTTTNYTDAALIYYQQGKAMIF